MINLLSSVFITVSAMVSPLMIVLKIGKNSLGYPYQESVLIIQ
jgi:hypothetical protein